MTKLESRDKEGKYKFDRSYLSVLELHDGAVAVPDGAVVPDDEPLQQLDEAPLEVAGPAGLDGRVDETLSTGHAVEKEILKDREVIKKKSRAGNCAFVYFLVRKYLNFLGVQVGALFSNFGCASS